MCGIAGIWNLGGAPVDRGALEVFTRTLAHRGPDGEGYRLEADGRLGLGHRRLAILDPTPAGAQPMSYADERWWVVYNGEIYNFVELRVELESAGYVFRTESDTEVLLAAWDRWGSDCLTKLNGMWAFAVWDRRERSLTLVRDRFGQKPLFYAADSALFAFASELKAFRRLAGFELRSDDEALKLTLGLPFALESTERTLVQGVKRLPPGHLLRLKEGGTPTLERWWRTLDHIEAPPSDPREQTERFKELFFDACRLRLRSDVPVATSLSGGLDSSSVVCTLAELERGGTAPPPGDRTFKSWRRAFVAEFPGTAVDERSHAELAVERAGVEKHIISVLDQVTVDDARQVISDQDEPYLTLLLPPWSVYREMRRNGVAVSLDGHGGDELLGGYQHHVEAALQASGGVFFRPGRALDLVNTLHAMYPPDGPVAPPSRLRALLRSDRTLRGGVKLARALWRRMRGGAAVAGGSGHLSPDEQRALGPLNASLYQDFHYTILPVLLRNFDRCSMAHSVEVRMPFLDYRLVCYAFGLPPEQKVGDGFTKRILRESMKGVLPEPLRTRRGKIGFNAPLGDWFGGFLREWLESQLGDPEFLADPAWDGAGVKSAAESALRRGSWDWDTTLQVWLAVGAHAWKKAFFAAP